MPALPPQTLRVGTVPYLVGRPVDLGLEDEPGIELVRQPPARLVEGLRGGELDVALVSSIELFRRRGYGYLDGPAVCGRGYVGSVQVFLRRPLREVRRLALDPASRTAQALVQVVLAGRAGGPPEYVAVAEGRDPADEPADAWLRIGDRALRESLAADAPPVLNPSELWCRESGLPFAFAVWIVAPGCELGGRTAAFARARARGAARIGELARRAARDWELPEEAALRYLDAECVYELGAELQPALFAFRDRAAALGLCRGDVEPHAIPVEGVHVP